MAGALAEREWDEAYGAERVRRRERRSLAVVDRGPRRRRGLGMRQRPGVWLIAFAVCVALLAVGRVTLSFAVVQKNMDTEALVREQRALRSENARLQEKLAGLMATPRLRELAMERFGLVSAQSVVYLEGGHLAASERSKGSPVVGSYDGSMQNEAGVLAGGRIAAGLIGDGGR